MSLHGLERSLPVGKTPHVDPFSCPTWGQAQANQGLPCEPTPAPESCLLGKYRPLSPARCNTRISQMNPNFLSSPSYARFIEPGSKIKGPQSRVHLLRPDRLQGNQNALDRFFLRASILGPQRFPLTDHHFGDILKISIFGTQNNYIWGQAHTRSWWLIEGPKGFLLGSQ